MIVQTLVEYGALQSISAAFASAYYRAESFLVSVNPRYYLILALAVLAWIILTRRRAH